MSEEEQLKLLVTNGMLVKRPMLITDDKVLVGFKEAEWEGINACKTDEEKYSIKDMTLEKLEDFKLGRAPAI